MFKNKTIIGLDIGTSSIKLAEVRKDKDGIKLTRARFLELNANEKKEPALAVNRILKLEKINFAKAIIAISGKSVFSRFVKLPKLTEQKLDKIIAFEAQQQIPFPLEEVIWDYQRIKKAEADGQISVALVAVKKDIVEHLVRELFRANIDIQTIDVAPYALYNALDFRDGLEDLVVLDIGAKTTNIVISREGRVWTRNLPIAGDDITKAIAKGLDISFESAEQKKRAEGIIFIDEESVSPNHASKFIAPVLTDLLTEVSRSIGYYKSQFDGAAFKGIVLTGGTSKLKNIDKFFENNLKLKACFCDYLKKLKPTPGLLKGDLLQYQHLMGVAIGLVLRTIIQPAVAINLIPSQLLKIREAKKKKKYIFGCGILAAASILLLNGQLIQKNLNIEKEIKRIDAVLAEYNKFNEKIEAIEEATLPIDKKNELLKEFVRERDYWLNMFAEITSMLKEDTWLTNVKFEDAKTILIEGQTTGSFLTVTQLKENIENGVFLKDVEILSANIEKDKDARQKINFSLKAVLAERTLLFR
ncbi:MAG: type IV pilus assembly protein PilM [Candidatus Omnitrophota bacterium]